MGWRSGCGSKTTKKVTMQRAAIIDAKIELEMRADKCCAFATNLTQRRRAEEELAQFIDGKACVRTFKLLGIWYNTTRRHRCHGDNNNVANS